MVPLITRERYSEGQRLYGNIRRVNKDLGLTSDGDTAEAGPFLDIKNVLNEGIRGKNDRIGDKTVLMTLDAADHVRLRLRGLIMVNHTNAAQKLRKSNLALYSQIGKRAIADLETHRHVNRHVCLSDRVHRA